MEVSCPHTVLFTDKGVELYQDAIDCTGLSSLQTFLDRMTKMLRDASISVWHINSTERGGSTLDTLQTVASTLNQLGVESRWLVLNGDDTFFRVSKRVQDGLAMYSGDSGMLSSCEKKIYDDTTTQNLDLILQKAKRNDICILYEASAAGLIPGLHEQGMKCIWQCKRGAQPSDDQFSLRSWNFLKQYVSYADAFVFSHAATVPDWIPSEKVFIIPPAIDIYGPKNQPMSPETAEKILCHIGIIRLPKVKIGPEDLFFHRKNGEKGYIQRHADIYHSGPLPEKSDRMILQVSRWEKMRDTIGLMHAFSSSVHDEFPDAFLVIAGPSVKSISDDPEMAETYEAIIRAWRSLPKRSRQKIQIACLPMKDPDESDAMVNALQTHATVICYWSLKGGMGLSLIEALWKRKPIIATGFQEIQDYLQGEHRDLVTCDPGDLDTLSTVLKRVLSDDTLREQICALGHDKACECYVAFNIIAQYIQVLRKVASL